MPTTCRTCGRALMTGAERKVGRCSSCPPTYDETTFEALRAWRLETAGEAKVPAYVVFTDATLTAIAETRPGSLGELAGIAGVGATKLERYGTAVLALLSPPADEPSAGKDPGPEPV
jgi:DNA helicase-2/ATP-dependent DNA helicase PcrA